MSAPRRLAGSLAVAWLAAASLGCGHVETHEAMLRSPHARTGGPVELYMVGQAMPSRPFYEIAIVQAVGYGNRSEPEDVARALTDRAAALGCDAVVLASVDVGYSRAHAAGVCVKFLAEGPPGPLPVLPERPRTPPQPPGPPLAPKWEPLPSAPPDQGGGR